jgi:hypothetical protein
VTGGPHGYEATSDPDHYYYNSADYLRRKANLPPPTKIPHNLQRYYDRYGRWSPLDAPLPTPSANNNNNNHKLTKLQTNIIKQRKLNTKLKQQVQQLKHKHNNKHNNKHKKQISTWSSSSSEDSDRDIEYNSEDNGDEDISLLSD